MRLWPGHPYPLGATWDGEGVNFALFSENATAVELCLFSAAGTEERVPVRERTNKVWHVYVPDARPGQLYGYRVHGAYDPAAGHRFNAHKLLLDPYAKAISGDVAWHDTLLGYQASHHAEDPPMDTRDSAPHLPKSQVIDSAFTWDGDQPPRVPWSRTVIYEAHVKGLSRLHPEIPAALRGTYLGLASEPVIDHLQALGVTAVELLPVHQVITEQGVAERGLTNYWGYNSLGFFAPDPRFATGCMGQQVTEFKSMVKTLHRAGIEVILDVVYNHTGEGDHRGPTVCLRGIDNAAYYRLNAANRAFYDDFTGCGNSLNMLHPRTLQLILDSLRYWVQHMHVDGFRFDLAPALAREMHEVNRLGRFFAMIQQDPVLSQVKLIAEPWDLGEGGYQVGNFPDGWAEWNGKYRDTVRRFWRGDAGQVADLAYRLSGSSDLYEAGGRHPFASINFVTCHDGFTLRDLVSYERKHNAANGEADRDGSDNNDSMNCGVEGPTDAKDVLGRRLRARKNFLATLVFSQGVPMLLAGDELGHTQGGNNNAYCQDNPVSWLAWDNDAEAAELRAFVAELLALRRANPVLRRRSFFRGQPVAQDGAKDLTWMCTDGTEMTAQAWANPEARCVGMLIHGHATDEIDERGRLVGGNTLLLLLNADRSACRFMLPLLAERGTWRELLNTARPMPSPLERPYVHVAAHALVLLTHDESPA